MTRTEARDALTARVRASLAARVAVLPAPLARPPCYDDEWAAGVAWLDRMADDDVWPEPPEDDQ